MILPDDVNAWPPALREEWAERAAIVQFEGSTELAPAAADAIAERQVRERVAGE